MRERHAFNRPVAERPTILTARLTLRPFTPGDAAAVGALCGDREIAAGTLLIPHPYSRADAEAWIATHQAAFEAGTQVVFAVALRATTAVVGSVGLAIERAHDRAELGYWIGREHWNRGYATEAARAVIAYAFETCALERVFASHFMRNPASRRVLEKAGMRHEGTARHYVKKWGVYEDGGLYALVRADFEEARQQ